MELFRCKKGASKLTIIIACCLGAAIVLGGGIWGITALRSDPVARQIELGHKYLEEGNYQQAILAFEEAIEIEPMSIEARLGLAKVYVALGDQEKAEQVLKDAIDVDPSRPEPYLALADIYLDQGREQDAVDTYLQAIANAPANPDAYLALARLYLDKGMAHEALAVLESFPGTHSDISALLDELTRVASIELDREKLWLIIGEIWTLRVLIEPVTAQDQSVQWSSSDIDVAEVSSEGVVTAKAEGTTVITVASFDGNRTASIEVEVENFHADARGNIVNWGRAATDGTWVYFRSNDGGSIYRMQLDGSDWEKLNNEDSDFINVVDGWVYYHNRDDGGSIYRIRTDGTSREKLNDDEYSTDINVVDGWVYYSFTAPSYDYYPGIYRMRIDGGNRERLSEDWGIYINVVDGWIYYANFSDNYALYRMRLDGTGREKLNSDPSGSINVVGGWVYYINFFDRNTIYRVRIDGSEREKLSDNRSEWINVVGGWVYYFNVDALRVEEGIYPIWRMRTDGSKKEELNMQENIILPSVINGWIYYETGGNGLISYRIRTDGSARERLP